MFDFYTDLSLFQKILMYVPYVILFVFLINQFLRKFNVNIHATQGRDEEGEFVDLSCTNNGLFDLNFQYFFFVEWGTSNVTRFKHGAFFQRNEKVKPIILKRGDKVGMRIRDQNLLEGMSICKELGAIDRFMKMFRLKDKELQLLKEGLE